MQKARHQAHITYLPNFIPRMMDRAAAGQQSLQHVDAGGTNHRGRAVGIAEC
jgi:hypothetical protein